MIVGIDEAGRGPLAGPLVVCAFYFKEKPSFKIKESKALNSFKRQELFENLLKIGIYELVCVSSSLIDKMNILNATLFGFNRAIEGIIKKAPFLRKATFLIDGPHFKPQLDIKYKCIIKGDQKIKEIASASILAKVFRDYLMNILDFLYPEWGFFENKGYPTKAHRELLKKIKPLPFHRQSFLNYEKRSFLRK